MKPKLYVISETHYQSINLPKIYPISISSHTYSSSGTCYVGIFTDEEIPELKGYEILNIQFIYKDENIGAIKEFSKTTQIGRDIQINTEYKRLWLLDVYKHELDRFIEQFKDIEIEGYLTCGRISNMPREVTLY